MKYPFRYPLPGLTTFSLLLFFAFAASASQAAERIVEESVAVDSDVRVTIKSHRGSVIVRTDDGDTMRIKAIITHQLQEAVDSVDIDIAKSRSRVTIEADYDADNHSAVSWFLPRSTHHPHVRFEVTMPDTASLTVDSHRSDMDIEAPSGNLEVASHRGNGDIKHIRNDLRLDTHRGNFNLYIDQLRDLRLDTHRGNIDIVIHKFDNVAADISTHRGNVRIRGKDIPVLEQRRESYVDFKEGTGENLIRIDSHRGNIGIDFRR